MTCGVSLSPLEFEKFKIFWRRCYDAGSREKIVKWDRPLTVGVSGTRGRNEVRVGARAA